MASWVEINVKTPSDIVEAVSNRMFELGSSGIVTDDTIIDTENDDFHCLKGYFPETDQFSSIFRKLCNYLDSLKSMGFDIGSDKVSLKIIDDILSADHWKQFIQTVETGKKLVIKPPWESDEKYKNKICIEINPAMAFGTGGHPTTRLCLTLIEEICENKKLASMLDVGCGSGVLSIAGKKMNIKKVVGVDTDPIAIEESIKNAKRNKLKGEIKFYEGSVEEVRECFSLIVANIYSGPLCRMMPLFKEKLLPSGKLIVSGIMNDQEETVLTFANDSDFQFVKKMREENWSAFLFRDG